jgi:ATP sulfurylase
MKFEHAFGPTLTEQMATTKTESAHSRTSIALGTKVREMLRASRKSAYLRNRPEVS